MFKSTEDSARPRFETAFPKKESLTPWAQDKKPGQLDKPFIKEYAVLFEVHVYVSRTMYVLLIYIVLNIFNFHFHILHIQMYMSVQTLK